MIGTAAAGAVASSSHRARVERCKATIPNFDAQTATVAEMQDYAGCVDAVYPQELSADATIALKVLFVIALAGLVAGIWRDRDTCVSYALVMGFLGAFLSVITACVVFGIVLGIGWLFS